MINVAKTVIEENNKYLLVRRSKCSKFFPNQWDFPGGKINQDEKPEVCAVRETKEETSLTVELRQLIIEGDHIEHEMQIHYRIYSTSEHSGKIKLSKDHSDFRWFSKEEINNLQVTPFVTKYFSRN
ncbi:MAG: NUDIX hydrolase [Candidatus Pacearchaeota archaeon]|jgi:8-oxo-dGTP diphosphatase